MTRDTCYAHCPQHKTWYRRASGCEHCNPILGPHRVRRERMTPAAFRSLLPGQAVRHLGITYQVVTVRSMYKPRCEVVLITLRQEPPWSMTINCAGPDDDWISQCVRWPDADSRS